MAIDFVDWLMTELQERGWSQSELARRAGVHQSGISMLLNGQTGKGFDTCMGIARALNMPPEDVLRLAGLLPELPAKVDDQQMARLNDYYRRLLPRAREELVEYAIFKYEREDC